MTQPDEIIGEAGGFHTKPLAVALEDLAPVAGRRWQAITELSEEAVFKADALRDTIKGFIGRTKSSVILRVELGDHWIIVDEVLPNGKIAIRDPASKISEVLTADELRAKLPTGDMVVSMPED